MIKTALALLFISFGTHAYVPTVESLFRHGGNPDISANTVMMSLKITKLPTSNDKEVSSSPLKDQEADDFYRLYITNSDEESFKLAQTRYTNKSFSESSLVHKIYHPNFTALTIKPDIEQLEKGVFFSLIKSIAFNDGAHLVNYLKALGVPLKLNDELINREKIEYLASYKRFLIATNRDRKKVEVNPLRPEDPIERTKVDKIMGESMYVDTDQVKLIRDNGDMSWMVRAGNFEAIISYVKRQVQRVKYKSGAGEFEIACEDYWLANGTHYMPKTLTIRIPGGVAYKVEISNLRHFNEKEEGLIRRMQKWDQKLRGRESSDLRPEFLL